ncbi:uncharacterized protein LY79DRAFT_118443 [Colletotrichum navitas]|uniref:Uncharacterized protein n=1 Tax=Colletotrichum navitas TaxID=681940 RepID=A0AAD8Q4I8_9PEZI|nr:uncharacterized protein LY79DRAFT_118443 [Colletotrichum navitas]KAK1595076.1 hypothetical protein LY79DRAFT_118443 [Colletotrichum navitas]
MKAMGSSTVLALKNWPPLVCLPTSLFLLFLLFLLCSVQPAGLWGVASHQEKSNMSCIQCSILVADAKDTSDKRIVARGWQQHNPHAICALRVRAFELRSREAEEIRFRNKSPKSLAMIRPAVLAPCLGACVSPASRRGAMGQKQTVWPDSRSGSLRRP